MPGSRSGHRGSIPPVFPRAPVFPRFRSAGPICEAGAAAGASPAARLVIVWSYPPASGNYSAWVDGGAWGAVAGLMCGLLRLPRWGWRVVASLRLVPVPWFPDTSLVPDGELREWVAHLVLMVNGL